MAHLDMNVRKSQNTKIQTAQADLVCFSHLRWNDVFQRPHHLMSHWGQERRVFFIEEYHVDSGPRRLEVRHVAPGVRVVTPYLLSWEPEEHPFLTELYAGLFADNAIERYVFWYYSPMFVPFTSRFEPIFTVYDCMDELANFKGAPELLPSLETELLAQADVVFTGGHSLYEAKKGRHPNVHPFPSSIDLQHFTKARFRNPDPEDQATIPHPRLGYFGVIDERMDMELLTSLADTHPDWHLVMVGPVAKLEKNDLPQAPNIHYLGKKSYEDLPVYLSGWDVALLPFALNPATEYISPTKTPEYLAGGKPVVSTPIRDVVRTYGEAGLVRVAGQADKFVQAIEAALKESSAEQEAWLERVDGLLAQNSWHDTWTRMKSLMQAGLDEPGNSGGKESGGHAAGSPEKYPRSKEAWSEPSGRVDGSQFIKSAKPVSGDNIFSQSMERTGNGRKPRPFDFLIVGAGFAGSVLAERLARGSGMKVLVIDQRNHIAGNAYDHYDEYGLLIHKYGPHIFHTNSKEVFAYLSRFTEWRPYEHRVLASVDGQLVPIPINLDTVNLLYGLNLSSVELQAWFDSVAEQVTKIKTSEDVVVSKVGKELYEKFFRNYTRKQWGLDPSELDASVTSRVPVRLNRDDRYFGDTFQSMPRQGYTRMFEKILDHSNIKVMLNTSYREIVDLVPHRKVIFTGPVDEYFDYKLGRLPYRSLEFQFRTFDEDRRQPVAVINYPNEHAFTRVTEFKHLTGQEHSKTTLVYEYPCSDGDPYYPIPRPENAELYKKYNVLAKVTPDVYFAGRLGTYRYYNMDQVTAQALNLYSRIMGLKKEEAAGSFTPARFQIDVPYPLLVTQIKD